MAFPLPDRRTPWAAAGYYFFSLAGLAIASPYLPLYWRSLGMGGAHMTALLTAVGLGPLLAQAPVGYLSDRHGRRRSLVCLLMALGAVVTLGYPTYRSFPALLAAALITNAVFRSADALVAALVGDWAAGTRMASSFGRIRIAGSISWVLSLLLSARVATMTDWRILPGTRFVAPMFGIIAACYAAAALCVLLAKTPPPRELLRSGPWTALRDVAGAPGMARFLLAFALFWTGVQSTSAFLSLFLKTMHASRAEISMAFALSAMSEVPFVFMAGRLADRWGERRILGVAFAVLPLRLLLYTVTFSPPLALAAQCLHGLTYGLTIVGSITYVTHRLPVRLRASGQGALGAIMSAAATLAPFLGGFVAHWAGWRGAFAVMVVVAVMGWIVLGGLSDDGRGEAEMAGAAAPER